MEQSISGAMLNGFTGRASSDLDERTKQLLGRRDRVLSPGYGLLYERPLELVRGEGRFMYDVEGVGYLDAYNNVVSLGHCHPRVVDAVQRQVATLNTNTRYLDGHFVNYVERLLATHVDGLDRALFTCSGSEAIDLCLRIARKRTGKRGTIVTANAYHGMTEAVSAISPSLGQGVPLDPSVRVVHLELDEQRVSVDGEALTRSVVAAIEDLDRHGYGAGAFVADSIFATDGVLASTAGFLKPVAEALRARGVLYIADEVQPGFARTGTHMWGYQRHGIVPDLVAMGKPMGNGMPIAAVVASDDVIEEFGRTARYFNTFAANSVTIAAASAVLDVIEEEGLLTRCAEAGRTLADEFKRICDDFPFMGSVRSAGLYFGIDVNRDEGDGGGDPAQAMRLVNQLRDQQVLISATGPTGSVLKVRPPLTITDAEMTLLLEQFEVALITLQRRRARTALAVSGTGIKLNDHLREVP